MARACVRWAPAFSGGRREPLGLPLRLGMHVPSIRRVAQETRSSPGTQKILDDLADLGRIVSPLKLSNRVMIATLASKKAAASSD